MDYTEPALNNITPLIPAATVILLRDKPGGGVEILMLRRNRALKAFGGAWVFPGGRVDPLDAPNAPELERARAAAVREAHEETGLTLSPDSLVPLSLWIPPVQEKRRFSTWFFIAEAPDAPVKIDDGEIHDYKWMCPRALVHAAPDPEYPIFPPTFISLYGLMSAQSAQTACETISRDENQLFETRFYKSEPDPIALWPGDSAYDDQDMSAPGPRRRLIMGRENWTYENSCS